jgi:hypothetical protein
MTISGSNQARDELATTTHTYNKCLNLGVAIGTHLGNLGDAASDRLNYTGLNMCYLFASLVNNEWDVLPKSFFMYMPFHIFLIW